MLGGIRQTPRVEWYNITILAPIGTVQNDTSMVEVSGISRFY
jgi:hypothetical protein